MLNLITPKPLELLEKLSAFKAEVPDDIKCFFEAELWMTRVRRELGVDLRDMTLRRDRQNHQEPIFESVRPLGLVGHIMPGNSDWTPLLAILESCVIGNKAWVKLPSDSDTSVLKNQLKQLGLEQSVAVFNQRAEVEALYEISDAISAWGSEASLDDIRKNISAQTRFIPWGHRMSFAYLTTFTQSAKTIAEAIVKYEQQACSSPQIVYMEDATFSQACDLAKDLASQLAMHASSFPELDASTWAELSNFTQTHRTESCLKEKLVLEGEKQEYRIVVDMDPSFTPSVLNRTIFIKPIAKGQLVHVLSDKRRLLQTAGVNCDRNDLPYVVETLLDAGVSRVCGIEDMQDAHPLEAHDGEYSLSRFVCRVSVHAKHMQGNIIPKTEVKPKQTGPITTKNEFAKNVNMNADYYFKSGGSSGKSILSTFKVEDYHLQMQIAADGLIASGLDPKTDHCMNLFFGGGLYGGFLSFTDILEKTGAAQYPMSGYPDLDFVIDTICEQKVNVLLGMPSYIVTLYKRADERGIQLPSEKIYYGGEPFSFEQMEWLKSHNVQSIRSASYGSVDAGPLAFQCKESQGSVHHVNTTIQNIEIVKLESDEPCAPGEVGRVLVTSLARSHMTIKRYELGDTAKWIEGRCACGDPAPRLELVGRIGDIFKFGGSFMNARKFAGLVGATSFQIILTKRNMCDMMTVMTDKPADEVRRIMLSVHDLHEVVELEKSCELEIKSDGYEKASSGKTPLLIDKRYNS